MKKVAIAVLILLGFLAIVSSCSMGRNSSLKFFQTSTQGDGILQTVERPITPFSKVIITGSFDVHWTSGKPSMTVTSEQNISPLITTVLTGDTLTISASANYSTTKPTTITLVSESLVNVQLTGGNKFKADHIAGDAFKLVSTGASMVHLVGAVDNFTLNLTGASMLDATSLQVKNATLTLVGAPSADVTVTKSLDASVTGAGRLSYAGKPDSIKQTIVGVGQILKRE